MNGRVKILNGLIVFVMISGQAIAGENNGFTRPNYFLSLLLHKDRVIYRVGQALVPQ